MRLLLINPNTNADTTALMVVRARVAAPPGVTIEGATVREGAPLLVDPTLLAGGARAVERLVADMDLSGFDGLVVAAFGDPGIDAVRSLVDVPVTGIAEALGRRLPIRVIEPVPAAVRLAALRAREAGR
jgi:allantoin racemase